jgi:hypothetical protein
MKNHVRRTPTAHSQSQRWLYRGAVLLLASTSTITVNLGSMSVQIAPTRPPAAATHARI